MGRSMLGQINAARLLRDGIGLSDALLPSQLDDPGAGPACLRQRCACVRAHGAARPGVRARGVRGYFDVGGRLSGVAVAPTW